MFNHTVDQSLARVVLESHKVTKISPGRVSEVGTSGEDQPGLGQSLQPVVRMRGFGGAATPCGLSHAHLHMHVPQLTIFETFPCGQANTMGARWLTRVSEISRATSGGFMPRPVG